MDALLVILFPLLLVTASIVIASNRFKGRRLKVYSLMLGIPFAIFFGDEVVEQAFLQTLCTVDGGYRHKEPIRTDGYFDVDETKGCSLACLEALTRERFLYYESKVSSEYAYHAFEKGFYKYYLANKGPGICSRGREIPRESGEYGILPNDMCVAYIKIIAPSSKYEVSMIRITDIVRFPFKLQKMYSYVKDKEKNEIVASATSYMYWGGWVRNNSFSHNGATVCPTFPNSHGAIKNSAITSNSDLTPQLKTVHSDKSGMEQLDTISDLIGKRCDISMMHVIVSPVKDNVLSYPNDPNIKKSLVGSGGKDIGTARIIYETTYNPSTSGYGHSMKVFIVEKENEYYLVAGKGIIACY